MVDHDRLGSYVNDHLAGAAGARELLARRLEREPAEDLRSVLEDIEDERTLLKDLLDRLGVGEGLIRQGLGWVAERVSQVKLTGEALRDEAMRDLFEMETLTVGVHGKQRLWRSLQALQPDDPALADLDLDGLLDAAEGHIDIIERHRIAAVRAAMADGDAPG